MTEVRQKLQRDFQGHRGKKTQLSKTKQEVFRKIKVQKINKEVQRSEIKVRQSPDQGGGSPMWLPDLGRRG